MPPGLPPPSLLLILLLLMLGSCSSPPKPPTVNESLKRPANSAVAVDLQACRIDLHNQRIVAREADRTSAATVVSLERLIAHQQALVSAQAASATTSPTSLAQNRVFTIRFEYGSAHVVVPDEKARRLIETASAAPLVMLRGRTDGDTESLAEGRIARERATAVRDYLVAAGVDPARIRTTYQPVGDHIADNRSPSSRGMNRRVEIELYQALPVALP